MTLDRRASREMAASETLTLIGYWSAPGHPSPWPDVSDFVDESWDREERDVVAGHLGQGLTAGSLRSARPWH